MSFAIHVAATWFMCGLIWTIQIVHYPLFAAVGDEAHTAYHAAHMQRITWLVLPVMLLELGTGLWLWWQHVQGPTSVPGTPATWWWLMGALGLIWLSTALLQVPQHEALTRGADAVLVDRLVLGNWVRTGLWTLRALTLLTLMSR